MTHKGTFTEFAATSYRYAMMAVDAVWFLGFQMPLLLALTYYVLTIVGFDQSWAKSIKVFASDWAKLGCLYLLPRAPEANKNTGLLSLFLSDVCT